MKQMILLDKSDLTTLYKGGSLTLNFNGTEVLVGYALSKATRPNGGFKSAEARRAYQRARYRKQKRESAP